MKKRSVVISNRKTSVSVGEYYSGLKEIAARKGQTVSDILSLIDAERTRGHLSSAVRVYVPQHYKALSDNLGPHLAEMTSSDFQQVTGAPRLSSSVSSVPVSGEPACEPLHSSGGFGARTSAVTSTQRTAGFEDKKPSDPKPGRSES